MIHLTDEQREALAARAPGAPVEVRDEQSGKVYWLIAPEDLPRLLAERTAKAADSESSEATAHDLTDDLIDEGA